MPFIVISDEKISIDDSDYSEKLLIETFRKIADNNGINIGAISCGLNPGPDLGYLELAERFWDASLCIYLAGLTNCFSGSGIGYSETWLFNARHAVELFIKGFFHCALWFNELQDNPLASGEKTSFKKIEKNHRLHELYEKYKTNMQTVISNWDTKNILEAPNISDVILSLESEEILRELDSMDPTSIRLRYPTFKFENGGNEQLQQIGWKQNSEKLLSKTGLPRESGHFFDHIKVVNSLYELVKEMKKISSCFEGYFDFHQDLRYEYYSWDEYLFDFEDEL